MSLEVLCFWCFDGRFSFSDNLFSTLLDSIMIYLLCVDGQSNIMTALMKPLSSFGQNRYLSGRLKTAI